MTSTTVGTPDTQKFGAIISDGSSQKKYKQVHATLVPHSCDYKTNTFYTSQLGSQNSAIKKLLACTMISFLFMITELIGGSLSNSLAIMTDAAH
jgi:Co/Zn/Cd efflux system component